MKYINLLCTNSELHCLFPSAKLLELKKQNAKSAFLKIKSEDETILINHYCDNNFFLDIENFNDLLNIDSYYINPIENLTIICDRQLWFRFYYNLLKNNKEVFDILEQRYVEKNVTILFNFAFLEALNYEDDMDLFLYDFKFNYIRLSDYELFENKPNTHYDSFFSLFHILSEGQLNKLLFPISTQHGPFEYLIDWNQIFENFNINNRLDRPFIYTQTCQKPRWHRIKFLLNAHDNNILHLGKNNVNIKFLEEYNFATNSGFIKTDNTEKHSLNHKKYFNKDLFTKFLKIKNKINVTSDEDPEFLFNHLLFYFKDKEYNDAYIDIVGETHCVFDLQFGFFTEKSLKPIIAKNFCMIYGSKKVYDEFKRIGVELFLDDFGLNGINNKNELEQIDMIISAIKKIKKEDIQNLYIKKYEILKNNQKNLFNYYCKIINKINKLLLKDVKTKII